MAQRKTTRRATKAGTFNWTTLFLGVVIGFILASLMYFWVYYHTDPIKGKAPGLQLPKPSQPAQVQEAPTTPPVVPVPATVPETSKASESVQTQDQIGQLIQQEEKVAHAKQDKAVKAPSHQQPRGQINEDTLGNYLNSHQPAYLQVGVFQSFQQADNLRARLLLLGYDNVQIKSETSQGKAVSKVWVGPYKTPDSLKDAQKALRGKGIATKVVH